MLDEIRASVFLNELLRAFPASLVEETDATEGFCETKDRSGHSGSPHSKHNSELEVGSLEVIFGLKQPLRRCSGNER